MCGSYRLTCLRSCPGNGRMRSASASSTTGVACYPPRERHAKDIAGRTAHRHRARADASMVWLAVPARDPECRHRSPKVARAISEEDRRTRGAAQAMSGVITPEKLATRVCRALGVTPRNDVEALTEMLRTALVESRSAAIAATKAVCLEIAEERGRAQPERGSHRRATDRVDHRCAHPEAPRRGEVIAIVGPSWGLSGGG